MAPEGLQVELGVNESQPSVQADRPVTINDDRRTTCL
jgi:hypothetical protein